MNANTKESEYGYTKPIGVLEGGRHDLRRTMQYYPVLTGSEPTFLESHAAYTVKALHWLSLLT